jgi:hypothetical protein
VALVLAGPAVAVAAIVVVLETYRAIQPDSILFVEPPAVSLAEALEHREVEVAYSLIRNGADPNATLAVADAALTAGKRVDAVSADACRCQPQPQCRGRVLLSAGVRVDLPANLFAACLAHDLGENDLETMIIRDGRLRPARPVRRPRTRAGLPLLRYLR